MPSGAGETANVSGPAGTESHTKSKSHKDSVNEPRYAGLISLSPRTLPVLETELRHPAGLSESDLASRLEHPCEERASPEPRPLRSSGRTAQARLGGTRGVHVQRRRQRRACARSYVGLGRRRAGQGGTGSHRGLEPSLTAGELEGPGPAGRPWPRPDVGCGVGSRGPGSDRRGSRCRAVRAPSRPPHSRP